MSENKQSSKIEEEKGFWEAYRGCTEENRVPPDRSGFYVRWVKDTHVLNRPGISVKSPADI